MPLVRTMALNETVKEDVGRINLKTFVSIESEVFRHMVAEFRGYIGYIYNHSISCFILYHMI